ncbi:MAG: type II secretion system protein [Oligoflexales bacterium]|nr:type II secretion system protein [Oligoflexales bacterium]
MSLKKRSKESSFTLLETMVALGLMVTMIIQISSVQGTAIIFSTYQHKVTQATWLAKAVMTQVEYAWKFYEVKEMNVNEKGRDFDEKICSKDPQFDCNFKYDVSMEKWDLPIVDLMTGGGAKKEEAGGDAGGGMGDFIKDQVKSILGDEILKIAHVEVYWTEGTRRDSVELTYLMTAQQKLDPFTEGLKAPELGVVEEKKIICSTPELPFADGDQCVKACKEGFEPNAAKTCVAKCTGGKRDPKTDLCTAGG